MEPGPLVRDIDESRNSIARRHALLMYRKNLDAAAAASAAWRHGGYLFLTLCGLTFAGSVVGLWREFPGEALIPWTSMGTSFLATYMLGRSARLNRRAIAGWPACPA